MLKNEYTPERKDFIKTAFFVFFILWCAVYYCMYYILDLGILLSFFAAYFIGIIGYFIGGTYVKINNYPFNSWSFDEIIQGFIVTIAGILGFSLIAYIAYYILKLTLKN
ncbi:MAG: hypothetical protein HYU63_02890 [Armatimonadetes bacterium]|nr:hypothetical protein [Armatimonadota bacterium]